jgi:hypothetical protein
MNIDDSSPRFEKSGDLMFQMNSQSVFSHNFTKNQTESIRRIKDYSGFSCFISANRIALIHIFGEIQMTTLLNQSGNA